MREFILQASLRYAIMLQVNTDTTLARMIRLPRR